MKTLQESIIGRKGVPARFTKDMLKPGYIVRYRDDELGMYFDYASASRIQKFSNVMSKLKGEGGFFAEGRLRFEYMPICSYTNNLRVENRPESGSDIMYIWPVNTQPQYLNQEQLEHLIKYINPIKINQ